MANKKPDPRNRYIKLLDKAEAACVAAIEIYNKPSFPYRVETFSSLMVNAWELMLKALILKRNNNKLRSIQVFRPKRLPNGDFTKKLYAILSRSGNIQTISIHEAINVVGDLDSILKENINAIIEIRDNAVHFINEDKLVHIRVQQLGTACLKNFLHASQEWFDRNLSKYDFCLMPLSFYHHDYIKNHIVRSEEIENFIKFIDGIETKYPSDSNKNYNVTLEYNIEFKKAKNADAIKVQLSTDPSAFKVTLLDEDIQKTFSLEYREVIAKGKIRYLDFKADKNFLKLMSVIKTNNKLSYNRYLNPKTKKGIKTFFNTNIWNELDKHYIRL